MALKMLLRKSSGLAATMILMVPMIQLMFVIPATNAASDDWWNDSWHFRKLMTVDHTKFNETLENFPFLLDINDSDLASKAQSDGDDIAFTDRNGTQLDHEIEVYSSSLGHLVAWIRIPLLSATVDTEIYLYYGNTDASSQQRPIAVWDSSFVSVQHLEETSGKRYDSTVHGNNATASNGVSKSSDAKIGRADEFNGISGSLRIPADFLPAYAVTIEFWVRPSSNASATWSKFINTGPTTRKGICGGQSSITTDKWIFGLTWDSGNKSFSTNDFASGYIWSHVAIAWNGTYCFSYVNGIKIKEGPANGSADWAGQPLYLGSNFYGSECFKGAIDEVQVSNIARSSGWITTSYVCQNAPRALYTIGNEEGRGGGPFLSMENPSDGATYIYTNPALSVRAIDTDGDPMRLLFRTNASGTWEDIASYYGVGNGVYQAIPASMKSLGTKYYWSVSVTDGTYWTNKTYSFVTTSTVLTSKWTATPLPRGESGVLSMNVSESGPETVVMAGNSSVIAMNGTDGSVIWNYSDSRIGNLCKPQIADLNRDEYSEIVVPLDSPAGIVVLFMNNGSKYWQKTGLGASLYSSPVIADIDGNGYQTVFVASTDVFQGLNGTGRVTSLSYDGRILHQTFAWRPCGGGLSIADTDSDGQFELYMGDRFMYEPDADYGKGLRSFWASNLTERWCRPDIVLSSHIPMLADVNKDGLLDVIAGNLDGGLAVFNSTDGSAFNLTIGIPDDAPVHYQPSVYDIDQDGNHEMIMADFHNETSDDIVVWDLGQWKIDARMYVGKCFYGPQVADVDGNGDMEIIAANYTGVFVFDKNYTMVAQVTGLIGILNYAVVQDIDGDGYVELVISNQVGYVYAFDTPARRPKPRPRSEVQFYSERRLGAAEYVPPPGAETPIVSNPDPPNSAANIPLSTTQLSFTITDYQRKLMNYTITTYPDIGKGNGTNVGNGRYSLPTINLQYSTAYTWNVMVTDGTSWNNSTYAFTTQAFPPWWNSDWQYRKNIRIDHTKVVGNLTSFPVLIDIVDSILASKARLDGRDIVFADANCNKLNHEIELYEKATGHLVAWVNVPFVSSAADSTIYMYYGNPGASNQQNPGGVWDSGFVMVQHLEELSGTRFDSTVNGNNGTVFGGVSKSVSGKIDGADAFNGLNGYIRVPAGFLPVSAITVEFWFEPSSYMPTAWPKVVNTGPAALNGITGGCASTTSDRWIFGLTWNSGGKTLNTNYFVSGYNWTQVVLAWNGTYGISYVNGVKMKEGMFSGTIDWAGAPFYLGANCYGREYFNGSIDEVRISNMSRSANWILTNYNNQKVPSTFYTIGTEEKVQEAPIIAALSPYNGAANAPIQLSELSFNLTDYQKDLMNYTVVTYPDVGSGNGTNVPDGEYAINVSNLSPSTSYTWTVCSTDSMHPANQTYTFTTEQSIPWWNQTWGFRKTITIDHTKVAADLSDFPVLIDVVDSDLANKSKPNGDDLIFIDSHGTRLSHEIEFYDNGAGHLVAWLSLPFLSSTMDTRFYMYYGNRFAVSQQNQSGVWDSGFVMVQHLEELSGTRFDSTVNGNNGTVFGGVSKSVSGKIDGADAFNGLNGYISLTGFLPTSALTIELWVKPASVSSTSWSKFINTAPTTARGIVGGQISRVSDRWTMGMTWDSGAKNFSTGDFVSHYDWNHLAITWNGTYCYSYVNGVKVRESAVSGVPDWAGKPFYLGSNYYGGECFNGSIDEVRVSSMPLSSAWLLSGYNNQKKPSNFCTIGIEERPPESLTISASSPSDTATRVPLPLTLLSFNLVNYQGRMMNYTVTTSPNIGSGSDANVFNGRYAISVSNVSASTTYTWIVTATDGTTSTSQTYTFTTYPGTPPSQGNPLLASSARSNMTDEDLTCLNQTTHDAEGDKVTNIYNWFLNNVSKTNLLLPFETNSSATVKDYSGYGNDGTIVGNVTWTNNGRTGGAYQFDKGYIRIPSSSSLDGAGQWSEITIEQWICLTAGQWNTRTIAKIPSYEIKISGKRLLATVWIDNGLYDVPHFLTVEYTVPLEINKWYHVALTYKSGEGLTLYVDGIAAAASSPISGNIQTSGVEPINLGWFDYFKGMIDDVRIYSRSLSPLQIYQQYIETKEGLTNNSTIVSQETKVGDVWKCQVVPNDSYQDGKAATSDAITIVSSDKPTAENLTITPTAPKTNDTLVATYNYHDPYEQPENGTDIRWYKNGLLQPDLNGNLTVSNSLTTRGDIWSFTVRPSNGTYFGTLQTSAPALIHNKPPKIDTFSPQNETLQINEGDNITFTQTSSDLDNDALTFSWILDQVTQSNAQNWTYTTTQGSVGTHVLYLVVSDGLTADWHKWTITVTGIGGTQSAPNPFIFHPASSVEEDLRHNYPCHDR